MTSLDKAKSEHEKGAQGLAGTITGMPPLRSWRESFDQWKPETLRSLIVSRRMAFHRGYWDMNMMASTGRRK
jgi:hypothetical protein